MKQGTSQNQGDHDSVVDVPQEVMQTLDKEIAQAGGPLEEPEEYKGSIARTMFDMASSNDGTVTVLFPRARLEELPRQSLVRIKSTDKRSYLGVVVSGPFAEPDGLRADSPMMVAVAVNGALMSPKFHGRAQVELISEELPDGSLVPPRRRPIPNSPVFVLSSEEASKVLHLGGEIRIGLADSHEDVEVRVPARKSVWPRHTGYLGTTGAGKSTTVSGQIAQLQQANFAVIILDTEGEYTAINEPTQDKDMLRALERRGLKPCGVQNTHVYHLIGRETRNPKHPSKKQFSLVFSDLSPYALNEILGLNEAQQGRLIKAYDITKLALDRLKILTDSQRQHLLELDELESGCPGMTLNHLYDVVSYIAGKLDHQSEMPLSTPQFAANREQLNKLIEEQQPEKIVTSWRAVQGRLGRIRRLKVFDIAGNTLDYSEMLTPGQVSIIDLSDTDSPQLNNLVIAQFLRRIQEQQDANYTESTTKNQEPKRTMIFIEEAHEFLSAQRISQMPVLFQQVARIARRGRKRWLGLGFITQLPQHLPDEVLGLINNWVLHKVNDAHVVARLRKSIGGIDDGLWNRLPSLAPGQAIVSFTSMGRSLQVAVDPTPCRLLLVD